MTDYVNWLEWLVALLTLLLAGLTGCAGVSVPTANYNADQMATPIPPADTSLLAGSVGEIAIGGMIVLVGTVLLLGLVKRKPPSQPPPST